jgi:hypothetical protein
MRAHLIFLPIILLKPSSLPDEVTAFPAAFIFEKSADDYPLPDRMAGCCNRPPNL